MVMVTCVHCEQELAEEFIVNLRNADNDWIKVCTACLDRIAGGDNAELAATAATQLSQPIVADEPLERDTIWTRRVRENLSEILASIAAETAADEASAEHAGTHHHRHHERLETAIEFTYRLARDLSPRTGMSLDISRGGMRFVNRESMMEGQILTLDTVPFASARFKGWVQPTAEVRRVERREDGAYDIGIRFVQRALAKESDRRSDPRIAANMAAFYHREEFPFVAKGRVLDLSRNGVRLQLEESLTIGEEIMLTIRGSQGEFLRQDLDATATVIHQTEVERGHLLIGCRLTNVTTIPRPQETT